MHVASNVYPGGFYVVSINVHLVADRHFMSLCHPHIPGNVLAELQHTIEEATTRYNSGKIDRMV
jgi:hypothetical protein